MAPIAQLVELRTFNPPSCRFVALSQAEAVIKPHMGALGTAEAVLSNQKALRYGLRYTPLRPPKDRSDAHA